MQIIQKSVRISIFLSLLQFTACFGLFRAGPEKRSLPAYLLAFLGGGSGGSATASEHTDLSSEPTVALPGSLSQYSVNVATSEQEAPRNAGSHFTAVGQAYDITLAGLDVPEGQHVYFGEEVALSYEYDAAALKAAGLIEDFTVFYYDNQTQGWLPVERTEVDAQSGKVTAYTTHFTTFVLTALPAPAGAPNAAPACIAGDFPAGLGGTGSATFMTVGEGFQYYQDRDYIIDPGNPSFQALGFQGALGISTCNGNSTCGTFAQHKHYEGSTYIQFTAHMAMDVYIMYDDRANPNPGQVPDWFNTAGFSYTGHNIGTTDPGANYNVFKKTYLPGQLVTLGGNRQGSTKKVETNYWVVLKPAGVTATQPPGAMCIANAPAAAPLSVTNLRAAPGSTVVNLRWELPIDPAFAGVVIRRSQLAPPATVTDGEAPGGSVIAPTAYRDEGLVQGASYFYSVFAVDVAQNVGPRVSTGATTSGDIDGDGLADSYEGTQTYETWFPGSPPPHHTAATNPDSDGDGQSDGMEWLLGSNPTNADGQRPVITRFEAITDTPNYNPTTPIILEGTDNVGITQWMITEAAAAPSATDPRWNTAIPSSYELTATGNHQLYAWARDAAGNVSLPYTPVQIQLDGISVADKLFITNYNSEQILACRTDTSDYRITAYSITNQGLQFIAQAFLPLMTGRFSLNNGSVFIPYVNAIIPGYLCSSWQDSQSRSMGIFTFDGGQFGDVTIEQAGHAQFSSSAVVGDGNYILVSQGGTSLPSPRNQLRLYRAADYQLLQTVDLPASCPENCEWPYDYVTYGDRVYVFTLNGTDHNRVRYYRVVNDQLVAQETWTFPPTWGAKTSLLGNGRYLVNVFSGSGDINTGIHPSFINVTLLDNNGRKTDTRLTQIVDGSVQDHAVVHDGALLVLYHTPYPMMTAAALFRIFPDGTATITKNEEIGPHMSGIKLFGTSDLWLKDNVIVNGVFHGRLRKLQVKDGSVSIQNPAYTHPASMQQHITYRHETNLPPQVQMGPERWLHFKPGNPISLNAHGYAFDPDAGQCNVDPANYQIAWEIVSAPPGSGATTVNIANVNSLNGASLIPDIAGEYTVRLTFTDHPGSCNGSPLTTSGQVKLMIGYEHKTKDWCYEDKNSVTHGPGATWYETDPGNTRPWYLNGGSSTKTHYLKLHFFSSPITAPESWRCGTFWGLDPATDCVDDHGLMLVGDWRAFLDNERANGTPRTGRPHGPSQYVSISCGYWHWWDYSPTP